MGCLNSTGLGALVGVKMTYEEKELLRQLAQKEGGKTLSSLCRELVMKAARLRLVELERKTVAEAWGVQDGA